jgi:predicted DNA-binding transcriptional regulator AlpA
MVGDADTEQVVSRDRRGSLEERTFGNQMNLEDRQLGQRLLTLDDVAATLGVSRAWVRDHATRRNPRIPVVRLGGKRAVLRFRPQDIESFIAAHLSVQQGGV